MKSKHNVSRRRNLLFTTIFLSTLVVPACGGGSSGSLESQDAGESSVNAAQGAQTTTTAQAAQKTTTTQAAQSAQTTQAASAQNASTAYRPHVGRGQARACEAATFDTLFDSDEKAHSRTVRDCARIQESIYDSQNFAPK